MRMEIDNDGEIRWVEARLPYVNQTLGRDSAGWHNGGPRPDVKLRFLGLHGPDPGPGAGESTATDQAQEPQETEPALAKSEGQAEKEQETMTNVFNLTGLGRSKRSSLSALVAQADIAFAVDRG